MMLVLVMVFGLVCFKIFIICLDNFVILLFMMCFLNFLLFIYCKKKIVWIKIWRRNTKFCICKGSRCFVVRKWCLIIFCFFDFGFLLIVFVVLFRGNVLNLFRIMYKMVWKLFYALFLDIVVGGFWKYCWSD